MAKLYNFEGVEQVGFEYCAGNLGLLLELDGLSWRVKTGDEFFDYLQHVLAPGLPAKQVVKVGIVPFGDFLDLSKLFAPDLKRTFCL